MLISLVVISVIIEFDVQINGIRAYFVGGVNLHFCAAGSFNCNPDIISISNPSTFGIREMKFQNFYDFDENESEMDKKKIHHSIH